MAPTNAATHARRALPIAVFVLIVLSAVPVILAPIIPTIDFYNHVARYFVLSTKVTDPVTAQNYLIHWRLVPNIGFDVVGTLVVRVLPIELAAKLLILIIFASQILGVWVSAKALGSRIPTLNVLLALPLLFSYILIWGFTNFLFAVGLSFIGIGAYLRLNSRTARSIAVGSVVGSIILLCHGFAYLLYGITLAGLVVGIGLRDSETVRQIAAKLVVLGCTAIPPTILFILSGTANPDKISPAGLSAPTFSSYSSFTARLAQEFWHRFDYTSRVASTGWALFDLIFLAAAVGLVTLALRREILRYDCTVLPALISLGLFALLCPPSLFGVGHVADRIPLVAAFVGVLGFRPGPLSEDWSRFVAGWFTLNLVRLNVILVLWLSYADQRSAFNALLAQVPPHSLILSMADLPPSNPFRDERRCEMWHPLLLPHGNAVVPLFADERMQPMALSGKLLTALKALPPGVTLPRTFVLGPEATLWGAKAAGFDYALICGRATVRSLPIGPAWQYGDLTLVALQDGRQGKALPPIAPALP